MLTIIQILSCMLLVVMYIPQITKIHKAKQTNDISFACYISRIVSTLISTYTLTLSDNGLVVLFGQYVSLVFSSIVFGQMIYYTYLKLNGKHVQHKHHAKHIYGVNHK